MTCKNCECGSGADLFWIDIPPLGDVQFWESTAQIAEYANGKLAITRGRFTSLIDKNTQPFCWMPVGFPVEPNTSVSIVANIGGVVQNIDCGTDGQVFGTTPVLNKGDFVYFQTNYPIKKDC